MKKPQMKKRLHIEKMGGHTLYITCEPKDTYLFDSFGKVFETRHNNSVYSLYINKRYDINEIIEYLENFNKILEVPVKTQEFKIIHRYKNEITCNINESDISFLKEFGSISTVNNTYVVWRIDSRYDADKVCKYVTDILNGSYIIAQYKKIDFEIERLEKEWYIEIPKFNIKHRTDKSIVKVLNSIYKCIDDNVSLF